MAPGLSTLPSALSDGDLTIRAMRDTTEEYELFATWRNQPEVREWWDPDDPPMTVQSAMAEYQADVRGQTATVASIIEVDGEPVGFVQFYPWSAYASELVAMGISVPAGAWGLDIFIGDPQRVGCGFGSRAVRLLCDHLLDNGGATAIAFGVEKDNARARRAYEKAGLVATREFLDTDTRGGRRVTSVLMVRLAS
jgi:aminoglycoside 6'-N-acetyltransferase